MSFLRLRRSRTLFVIKGSIPEFTVFLVSDLEEILVPFNAIIMKNLVILIVFLSLSVLSIAQSGSQASTSDGKSTKLPKPNKVWVFLLAGQSNMAGRGVVEAQDTLIDPRIFSINAQGEVIFAKEPLHFYEPNLVGLDCGLSFGKALLPYIPKKVSILILPTAVGGSSIGQWLGDSTHRKVKLWSNFLEKVAIGKKYGQIKGILWHQGESDANDKNSPLYPENLARLLQNFRTAVGNPQLPVLMGELGAYSQNPEQWKKINQLIWAHAAKDLFTSVISTQDLQHKGDKIHFDSAGQRVIGQRFAEAYLAKF
jgi:Carbohydrate esterase, sialic acid-specific acetylesterase